jgi:hypothetical protein
MRKSCFIILVMLIALVGILSISCSDNRAGTEGINNQIRAIARPDNFNFGIWQTTALYSLLREKVSSKSDLTSDKMLRQQIESLLLENEITIFPPLNFRLETPPHLLVISPRDKIYYLDRVLLRQDLNEAEMIKIEAEIDKLGVSSLVTGLGGFAATYPPIVNTDSRMTYVINTVIEEWLHQYLAFKPLGFRYVLDSLGIKQDPDVITMNETLAGLVSREIGSQVYNRYYAAEEVNDNVNQRSDFNFSDEMRKTRQQVDVLLSTGKINIAERYMEEQRLVFVSHGYKIRKLNQAYFAFHNIYAHDPASVSPIHNELTLLRTNSGSLKNFLDRASNMTSYANLLKMLNE